MVKSRSFIATPPGATIKEQLLDRGLSQKEFAVRMGMSEKHISKLINGEVQLTPDVAAPTSGMDFRKVILICTSSASKRKGISTTGCHTVTASASTARMMPTA